MNALSQSASQDQVNSRTGPSGNANSAPAAGPQATGQNATSAGGAGPAPAADTALSQADRVRFVERVQQAFQDLGGQGGSVRLRLSPPELGTLNIDIRVAKGVMTARVEAETPAARNILLDNLPVLRNRLAQHDIKVQRFNVNLMDRSGSGASNQSWQNQQPSQQPAPTVRGPDRTNTEAPAAVEAVPARTSAVPGRLNVVV